MKLYYGTEEEVKKSEGLFTFDAEPPRHFDNKSYTLDFTTRKVSTEVLNILESGRHSNWIVQGKRLPRKKKKLLKNFIEGWFGYIPHLVYSEIKGFTGTKRWPAKGWVTKDEGGCVELWGRYPKPFRSVAYGVRGFKLGIWTIPDYETAFWHQIGIRKEGYDCVSWEDVDPTPCLWWKEDDDLFGIRILPELRDVLPF